MDRIPNVKQQEVADDLNNNIVLFASAGTGKTFTVAQRVANILASGAAKAEEILCLTFTIKACKEMQEDIFNYAGEHGQKISVHTIHNFCYKLLLEENKRAGGLYSNLGICDEIDEEETLRSILTSRCRAWRLEKDLKALDIAPPDLEECALCKLINSDELFYAVEDKLINFDGIIYDAPTKDRLAEVTLSCPICGFAKFSRSRTCDNCGYEYNFSLSKREFEILTKRTALRNLVSEIKHCREEQGFYSNDEIFDN